MLKFSILVIFDGNSYRKNHTIHLFIKRSQYCKQSDSDRNRLIEIFKATWPYITWWQILVLIYQLPTLLLALICYPVL